MDWTGTQLKRKCDPDYTEFIKFNVNLLGKIMLLPTLLLILIDLNDFKTFFVFFIYYFVNNFVGLQNHCRRGLPGCVALANVVMTAVRPPQKHILTTSLTAALDIADLKLLGPGGEKSGFSIFVFSFPTWHPPA